MNLDKETYFYLVVAAALLGAAIAVNLSVLKIVQPAIAGAAGFAIVLWVRAWSNTKEKRVQRPSVSQQTIS